MMKRFEEYRKSDDGAVTVDWVVLTAAIVLLAGVIVIAILNGSTSLGTGIGDWLSTRTTGGF